MTEQEGNKTTLSPQQLEQLWAEHLKGEFETKDVEETLATMGGRCLCEPYAGQHRGAR